MSEQNPASGHHSSTAPHDPEHDPTAVLRPRARLRRRASPRRVVSTTGETLAGVLAAQRPAARAHPAVEHRRRRRGLRPGPPRAGGLGAHVDRRPRRRAAAPARPRARPPGRDHRPDRAGSRARPASTPSTSRPHRADRALLRAHGARAPRHPARSAACSRCSPGSRSTACPRVSSASSRPGTTPSRWRCATASRPCSPATRSSPSPTPRRCSPRCSAPSCSRRPASRASCGRSSPARPARSARAMIERADYICFTGSTATGKLIAAQCAERLIGCSLELGGKNPILVLRDADVEKAAEGAVRASFSNAGQLCVSMERMFVADQIYDRFVERFVARTEAMTLGASHRLGRRHGLADLAGPARHRAPPTSTTPSPRAPGCSPAAGRAPTSARSSSSRPSSRASRPT